MIGLFVITALILTVAAVGILGSGSFLSTKKQYVLYFKHSVKGLTIGSPVALGGVKIGSVKAIRIHADSRENRFSIPVFIEIEEDTIQVPGKTKTWEGLGKNLDFFIEKGLRAQLEIQSMVTGQLLVSLDFHPEKPAILHQELMQTYPEIPTIESDIEAFTRRIKQVPIQEIFAKFHTIMGALEEMLNSGGGQEMIRSLTLTLDHIGSLAGNMGQTLPATSRSLESLINDTRKLVQTGNRQLEGLGDHLHQTLTDFQTLAAGADAQISAMGREIGDTAVRTRTVLTQAEAAITPLTRVIEQTAGAFEQASLQTRHTLEHMEEITHPDAVVMSRLSLALEEVSQAARSFRALTQYLERHPEALLQGKQ